MNRPLWTALTIATATICLTACSSGGGAGGAQADAPSPNGAADADVAASLDGGPDASADAAHRPPDGATADASQGDAVGGGDAVADTAAHGDAIGGDAVPGDAADTAAPPPLLIEDVSAHWPFDPPADPLAGSSVESCATIDAVRCVGDHEERCAVYDPANETFVDDVPPLLLRALHYDRWRDLYHAPTGIASMRVFKNAVAPGTPEAEWGSLDNFAAYTGFGDGAIWTGAAINAAALRYVVTGTQADYDRMVEHTRQGLLLFDVTGVPGYLARAYYATFPPGAPPTDRIIVVGALATDHAVHPFDAATVPGLDPAFTEGLQAPDGTVYKPTGVYWHGIPSIDQYSGMLMSLPLVYGLLRPEDDDVRTHIREELRCYLNRLERIEIHNIHANPQIEELLQGFLAGGALDLDPGDPNPNDLDTVVIFAHRQINSKNADTLDRTCPDGPPVTPARVLDAASDTFMADVLDLVGDLRGGQLERPHGYDHAYYVNVRGGDAIHMIHLALVVWMMTGDDAYKAFLLDDLLGNLRAHDVALTTGALHLPRWCESFFGAHITYTPLWSLLTLLDDGALKDRMVEVMEQEMWGKLMWNRRNLWFDAIYLHTVPPEVGSGWAEASELVPQFLETFGGNGGVLDDPRRNYNLDRQTVLDALPPDNPPLCPTEEQRAMCEDGVEVFGTSFGGRPIGHPCGQGPQECPLSTGECAWAMATWGLPPKWLPYSDFIWQRNTFQIGDEVDPGYAGRVQADGTDLSEPFWLARAAGIVDTGKGLVLAWKPTETACTPPASGTP